MKQINIVLVFLMIVFVTIPFFLPNKIDQKSSFEIDAPIGLVYDQFSDLRAFSKWELFTAADSLTQKKFFGNENEQEAVEWKSSTSSVGNGKITVKDSEINKSINFLIHYEGWKEDDQMSFSFDQLPQGTTKVDVQYISQEVPYFYRYFAYFNSPMKKVEESVHLFNDQIKVRLDKERKEGNLIYGEYRVVKLPKQVLIAVKKVTKVDNDIDYMKKADEAFEAIYKALVNEDDTFDFDLGFPKIYRTEIDREKDKQTIFAGISLIEDLQLKGAMQRVIVPEGEYLLTLHQGPRSQKQKTVQSMKKYAESKKINLTEREIEVLLNDPKETDSLQLKSRIYIPIKKD